MPRPQPAYVYPPARIEPVTLSIDGSGQAAEYDPGSDGIANAVQPGYLALPDEYDPILPTYEADDVGYDVPPPWFASVPVADEHPTPSHQGAPELPQTLERVPLSVEYDDALMSEPLMRKIMRELRARHLSDAPEASPPEAVEPDMCALASAAFDMHVRQVEQAMDSFAGISPREQAEPTLEKILEKAFQQMMNPPGMGLPDVAGRDLPMASFGPT